jgi:hypothetical protein
MIVDQSCDAAVALDGNAAAGTLSDLFALDVTAASVTCRGCGATFEVGAARVYGGGMGSIFRCVQCNDVIIRLVRTPAGFWLDMQGARRLFVRSASE